MADWGRFCGLLSLLVDARMPLPQALRLSGAAATTLRVRRAAYAMAAAVESGQSAEQAATGQPSQLVFDPSSVKVRLQKFPQHAVPAAVRHAFRWADRPDVLSEALAGLAELSARRTRGGIGLLLFVIEPLILLFAAGLIGFILLGLFMPLVQLLNDLS